MISIPIPSTAPYTAHLGPGLLQNAAALIPGPPVRAMIVSDDNVFPLYGPRLAAALEGAGYETQAFVFPAGETSKSMSTLGGILNALAEARFSRQDLVVALGGGVTGDLSGFAAACYRRGMGYVQCPTSLLAMVDSSVGGKTGVDLPAGKNLAGAIHQPLAVIADTDALSTLPSEQLRQGEAEMLKYAMLGDPALLDTVARGGYGQQEIARCIRSKAEYVRQDEQDHGVRRFLNLGHTLGHGVEALSGYEIPHGDAVAAGMALMTRAACALGVCGKETLERLLAALAARGLPAGTEYSAGALLEAARGDKKGSARGVTVVLPERVGRCRLQAMTWPELERLIKLAKGEG